MKSKYVITGEYENVILFPEMVSHDDLFNRDQVISAGFFSVKPDKNEPYGIKVNCYGRSVSLKLSSRSTDAGKVKALLLGMEAWELDMLTKP